MKTQNVICAAFVAAMAFVGCQKDSDMTPENRNLKSIEVNLNNVVPGTKAIGGLDESLEGKNIQLNSIQFFFSDGTTLYDAKDADGNKAATYFDATELAALDGNISAKFHFLPAVVKKVIVLGNCTQSFAGLEADLGGTLEIAGYQDVKNFPLYAEGALVAVNQDAHNNGSNAHLSNVYTVTLDIYPHVARFEITGIGCTLPTGSERIVKVNSIAFADFFDKCDFRTGTGSLIRSVNMLDQQAIYSYFQTQMSTLKWNNDFFNGKNGEPGAGNSHPVIELTTANPFVQTDVAYNFFYKGAAAPMLLLNVVEYENQEALDAKNGTPGYLFTNKYRLNSNEEVSSFEPGKIYRMDIRFTEEDLQHQERCLDITLNIAKWIVINVNPEF